MKKLGGGTSTGHTGDIDRLQSSVDNMLYALNDVYVKYYDTIKHKRKVEMEALQEQINPHFLYNIFDMINWMAIKNNVPDISAIVENLALYFRLSLNKGRNIVAIEDEIELSKVYMEIQNTRYSNRVTVNMNVPDKLKDFMIPKITFQPIIENALIHGIRQKLDKRGTVSLDARIEGSYIFVEITDDGIGMSEETLCKVLSGTQRLDEYVRTGYGLYNVSERLKMFSNDLSCGLSFKSAEGVGTTVTIKFAAKYKQ